MPAGLLRNPEDAFGAILVRLLGVRALVNLCHQLGVALLKGIRDVLKEDEAEHDMLVLGGVHAATKGIGHLPQVSPVV